MAEVMVFRVFFCPARARPAASLIQSSSYPTRKD